MGRANINGRCTVHNNEKCMSYRRHRTEAFSGCNPAVNKPRLPISSLDIIIKLKLCWQRPKYWI